MNYSVVHTKLYNTCRIYETKNQLIVFMTSVSRFVTHFVTVLNNLHSEALIY